MEEEAPPPQHRELETQQNGDVRFIIFLFVAVFIVMVCGHTCRCLLKRGPHRNDNNNDTTAAANESEDDVEAGRLRKKLRTEFIEQQLPSQVVQTGRKERSAGSLQDGSSSVSVGQGAKGRSVCAICIMDYCNGDKVCSSPNKKCPHTFHRECMVKWLVQHDDCPCCRQEYLPFKELSLGNNDK